MYMCGGVEDLFRNNGSISCFSHLLSSFCPKHRSLNNSICPSHLYLDLSLDSLAPLLLPDSQPQALEPRQGTQSTGTKGELCGADDPARDEVVPAGGVEHC